MSLVPKPFYELLKMEFEIPPYQRGYRWDNEQVDMLLDDLYDFIKSHGRKPTKDYHFESPYYCLQPIAVVRDELSAERERFIVVDGQQRLTTIYMLLHYLRTPEWEYPIYTLRMKSRDVQDDYINKCLFKSRNANVSSDIDVFYLEKAYEAICKWFAADPRRQQQKDKLRKLFAYEPDEDEEINDVRVIWYEIPAKDALEAFRRLNYGKIPLTSTELIKALLLRGNSGTNGKHSNGTPYRRALEWDEMEHTLHNPYLWSMFSSDSSDSLSRLDIILDFVADKLNESLSGAKGGKHFVRKDSKVLENPDVRDYFNYNVINEYINLNINGDDTISVVWEEIRTVFNLITNWYGNSQWYHLIGLLRILPNKRKSQRDMFKTVYNLAIDKDGNAVDCPIFTKALIDKIGDILRENFGEMRKKDPEWFDNLNYNDNPKEIIQLLKVLNVKEAMDDTSEDSRFAFHLFDEFNVTSLEHIHPQNITTNESLDDFRNWVARRSEDFGNFTESDFSRILKGESAEISDEHKIATKEEIEEKRDEVKAAIETLNRLTANSKLYKAEENQARLQEAANTLDSVFGELSAIKESELHSIGNLALVDQPTNSCLQNYFLDHKRDILMSRHNPGQGRNRETYAPPATRKVFCKEYSRSHPGDMRLWTRDDRKNYVKAIKKAFNYFIDD